MEMVAHCRGTAFSPDWRHALEGNKPVGEPRQGHAVSCGVPRTAICRRLGLPYGRAAFKIGRRSRADPREKEGHRCTADQGGIFEICSSEAHQKKTSAEK